MRSCPSTHCRLTWRQFMAIDNATRARAYQHVRHNTGTGATGDARTLPEVAEPAKGWGPKPAAGNRPTASSTPGARPAPDAARVASGSAVLERGMTGDAVAALQRALHVAVDGVFGAATEKALIAFKTKVGAALGPPTGIVNQATQRALDAQTFSTHPGFADAPSLDDVKAGKASLKRGMAGQAVADMQRRLNAAGLKPPLIVDGKMGPFTETALKKYQEAIGEAPNGVFAANALEKLDADVASGTQRPMKPYFEEAVKASRAGLLENRVRSMYDSQGNYRANDEAKYLDQAIANETSGDRADLARAAIKSAMANQTVGKCARGVRMALAQVGVHEQVPSAYMYADRLAARRDFQEISVPGHDLSKLPPGCVVVYGRSNAHPDGHVTVSLGGGKEASDHIQNTVNPTRYGDVRVFLPV